jgi:Holliday junction resolvase RusA-like endonuclease
MKQAKFTLKTAPRTKKNHGQIIRTKSGRLAMLPSKQYLQYEKEVGKFITNSVKRHAKELELPVNVKATFFMPTYRRVDLVNLEQALLDALVKYDVLDDDNYTVVASMDGSCVRFDAENPRTEVVISEIETPHKGQGVH